MSSGLVIQLGKKRKKICSPCQNQTQKLLHGYKELQRTSTLLLILTPNQLRVVKAQNQRKKERNKERLIGS